MQKIDTAVSKLHEAGIIWGDASCKCVDGSKSNAWVVDFGGGYTKGWVDKAVAGTVEGDDMGMANMQFYFLPIIVE